MNTIHTKAVQKRRIVASAVLAGAIAASALGAAATANARPPINPGPDPAPPRPASSQLYSSIALSSDTGVWASWVNGKSFNEANFGALNACQSAGGSHCVLTGYSVNQCVALAVDAVNWEIWHTGLGPTPISAETAALQANGNSGRIATAACTYAGGPDRAFTGRVNQMQNS